MATQKITSRQIEPQEVWNVPQYSPAWGDYDTSDWYGGRFLKNQIGMVVMKGLIRNVQPGTNASQSTIFILPIGYRPSTRLRIAVACAAGASTEKYIDVLPDGRVLNGPAINTSEWMSLSGVTFLAEQ